MSDFSLPQDNCLIYTNIAHALARGYTDLYYVNMETDELIEYHTDDENGVLNEVRRSSDFFEGCERDAKYFVYPDDQEVFIQAMNKDFLKKQLEENKVFELTYRRIKDDRTFYVQMKVTRVENDKRFIIIAVSDIDELMRKRQAEERIKEERQIYARLHALTGNFICVYVVNPDNNHYREFNSIDKYTELFSQAKSGDDFFITVREKAHLYNHPEDMQYFLLKFTKENVLSEIKNNGFFTLGYRFKMEDRFIHVQMKAAIVEESEGPRLIVGLNNIDEQVRQEEEYIKRYQKAQEQASIDALTGVKNRHAFLEAEVKIDRKIAAYRQPPFAVSFFDVNDLKRVNDTKGHQAGDQYLKDACKVICNIFKHSPVYRVGGDEFAVISQGEDYVRINELIGKVTDHNIVAKHTDGVVIACGMAKFENDECVASVFERADHNMYENKNELKVIPVERVL